MKIKLKTLVVGVTATVGFFATTAASCADVVNTYAPAVRECFREPCNPPRLPAPAPLIRECFQAPCFPTPPR